MKPLVLVLGGARSGKSRHAETLAARASARLPVTYVATAGPPRDAEMAARIKAHIARRPAEWATVDAPRDLLKPLREGDGLILIDCLTLWLTNVMLAEEDVSAAIKGLDSALEERRSTVIAVSNEVGEGIVPATSLGRRFRDEQGVLNQMVARRATHVVKMVAGCPILVKPRTDPEIAL
ncbi:MAG: bifunctional adenosylcobinamide kinase/adenosylcobinamide-phosphate guanylyltransferase [Pseudomonadota bacterium]